MDGDPARKQFVTLIMPRLRRKCLWSLHSEPIRRLEFTGEPSLDKAQLRFILAAGPFVLKAALTGIVEALFKTGNVERVRCVQVGNTLGDGPRPFDGMPIELTCRQASHDIPCAGEQCSQLLDVDQAWA